MNKLIMFDFYILLYSGSRTIKTSFSRIEDAEDSCFEQPNKYGSHFG